MKLPRIDARMSTALLYRRCAFATVARPYHEGARVQMTGMIGSDEKSASVQRKTIQTLGRLRQGTCKVVLSAGRHYDCKMMATALRVCSGCWGSNRFAGVKLITSRKHI